LILKNAGLKYYPEGALLPLAIREGAGERVEEAERQDYS
jgi:hypothetical protein